MKPRLYWLAVAVSAAAILTWVGYAATQCGKPALAAPETTASPGLLTSLGPQHYP